MPFLYRHIKYGECWWTIPFPEVPIKINPWETSKRKGVYYSLRREWIEESQGQLVKHEGNSTTLNSGYKRVSISIWVPNRHQGCLTSIYYYRVIKGVYYIRITGYGKGFPHGNSGSSLMLRQNTQGLWENNPGQVSTPSHLLPLPWAVAALSLSKWDTPKITLPTCVLRLSQDKPAAN